MSASRYVDCCGFKVNDYDRSNCCFWTKIKCQALDMWIIVDFRLMTDRSNLYLWTKIKCQPLDIWIVVDFRVITMIAKLSFMDQNKVSGSRYVDCYGLEVNYLQ